MSLVAAAKKALGASWLLRVDFHLASEAIAVMAQPVGCCSVGGSNTEEEGKEEFSKGGADAKRGPKAGLCSTTFEFKAAFLLPLFCV